MAMLKPVLIEDPTFVRVTWNFEDLSIYFGTTLRFDSELSLFFASMAASYTVSNHGNKNYINNKILKKNLEYVFNW